MIDASSLVAGPDADVATRRALDWADETAGPQPQSILCLTQSQDRAATIRDQWRESRDQLRIRTLTLDEFVSGCYERTTASAEGGTLGRADRLRLVETAIERYDPDDGPFADVDQLYPDLIDQVQGVFSLLEYAGYNDAASIETALHAAGRRGDDMFDPAVPYGSFRGAADTGASSQLAEQASTLSALYAEYERLCADHRPEWETVIAERYFELLETDALVEAVPGTVDAIVFDGLTRLAPLERAAIQRLDRARPAVAVLPLVHPDGSGEGIDDGVAESLAVYRTLGFQLEYDVPADGETARLDALRQLGVFTDSPDSYRGAEIGLRRWQPPTERAEVRTAARRVRELLADGVDPADIGIVVTDRASYRGRLAEVLPAYDVPFTFVNKIGFEQTLVGDALLSLLDIADESDGGIAVRALAGNQLVSLSALGIDEAAVERVANETSADSIDVLLTALDEDDADLRATIAGIEDLHATLTDPNTLDTYVEEIEAILEVLEVPAAVEGYSQRAEPTQSHRPAYESSAWSAVERVLASFDVGPAMTAEDPPARLRQALVAELVSGPRQQRDYVRVLPLAETAMESFEHLFVLGLTAGYIPTESDRMAFFADINDADEEFSRAHTGRRARYLLGTLLSGSDEVVLSSPRHTVEGTEHTTAPIVAELERYVEFDEETDPAVPLTESEDVQRRYASWATRETFESPDEATTPLATADGLDDGALAFARNGVSTSWHRSRPGVSPHEAQLGDVFEEVFSRDAVEPFSPSALEDYARCPFLYLTKSVLGFEEEYDDDAEITRGDRGTYVHDVLASFYRRLRTTDGEPVDLTEYDRDTLEDHLLHAATDHLEEFEPLESLFARRTMTRLLAGLGDPDDNEYYSGYLDSSRRTGGERGLFVRFLDEECEDARNRQVQPTHFEAAVSLRYSGTELLHDGPVSLETPRGPVDVHGIADRIETHHTDGPFSVVDYKTGQIPGKIDVRRGTKLQLPLYGLVFESVFDSGDYAPEAVAGSYYDLSDPSSVDAGATFASSAETQYGGDPPLVAGSGRPMFDSRDEFSRFVRDVTASRVGQIAASVEAGSFEPTLLDEGHANCDSCSFQHVCDVRNHHRRETIADVDGGDHYISERARDVDLALDAYPRGGDD